MGYDRYNKKPFITIESNFAECFEKEICEAMNDGYELHGEPQFSMVSVSDEWMGRKRGWTESKYVQMMKLKQNG